MKEIIFFVLIFWTPAGLLNYVLWLIECKIKKLKPPKSYKTKVFTYVIAWGVPGLIFSILTYIGRLFK